MTKALVLLILYLLQEIQDLRKELRAINENGLKY